MRKILLLIVLFGATITGLRAQVGIGTKTPNSAALLDITSDAPMKKGLLIPRVELTDIEMTLSGATSKNDMPNSILVFNTGTFTSTVNGVAKGFSPGYYYWDSSATGTTTGGAWVPLLSGGTSENVQNFFNTVNTSSSTVVYNKASNTFDLSVGNGLANLKDGSGKKYVGLGGPLTTDTTIDLGTFKLKVSGLKSSTVQDDEIVVVDKASGELKKAKGVSLGQINVGAGNFGKVLSVDSSGAVTLTTIGMGGVGTLSSTNSSTIVYNSASNTFEVKVGNGLRKLADGSIALGGTLSESTVITTDAVNTLAITGLQSGTTTNTLVVTDANGVLKKVSGVSVNQILGDPSNKGKVLSVDKNGVVTWTTIGGGASSTSSSSLSSTVVYNPVSNTLNVKVGNGLKEFTDGSGNKYIGLGGDLTKSTTIETTSTRTLSIKGLETGTVSDSFVVVDKDGKLKKVDPKSAAKINYTNGPQDTGRKWTLGTKTMTVQEITFEVTFSNTTTVDIATVLKGKHIINNSNELKVLSIRAIEKTGDTASANNKPTSITQSGVYDPTKGELTLGMSTTSMFSVTFNGTFYVVLEFIKL